MKKKSVSERLVLDEINHAAIIMQQVMRGMTIGHFIKCMRQNLKMSQQVLARRSGIPQSMISNVESDRKEPTIAALRKILDGLSCDLVLAPVQRESIESMRGNQAKKVAAKHMRYVKGTMNLEKQKPDKAFSEGLEKHKEEELLHGPGKDLWE